jgi:hypothetical protein
MRWLTSYFDRDVPVGSQVEATTEEDAQALLVRRGLGEMLGCSEDELANFPRTPRPSRLLTEFLRYPTAEGGLQLIAEVQRVAHIALRANPGLDPAPLLSDGGPTAQAIELVGWILHNWLKDLEDREEELEERIYKLRQELRELEAAVPGLPQ